MTSITIAMAFSLLIAGSLWARVVSERAFRALDDHMKIAVMNEFSGMRIWNAVPILVLVMLMMTGNALFTGHELWMLMAFIASIMVYFITTHRMIRRKFKNVQAPEVYQRALLKARWISYASIFLMLLMLLGGQFLSAFLLDSNKQ